MNISNVLHISIIGAIIFLLSSLTGSYAQKNDKVKKISCPEKRWAVFHPFITKRAYRLTKLSLLITDSIYGTTTLDGNINGGQVDAFKHSYWMALLSKNIGPKKSRKLGKAHEKGNYKTFKKAKRKSGKNSHDKAAGDMDLWNNEQGIEIANKNPGYNNDQLIKVILEAILEGKMKIIKINTKGEFLDKNDEVIDLSEFNGEWDNGKVLVPSDYIFR